MRKALLIPLLAFVPLMVACSTNSSKPTASSSASPPCVKPAKVVTSLKAATVAKVPVVETRSCLTAFPTIKAGSKPPPTKLLTKNIVDGTGTTVTTSSTVTVIYVGVDYTTGQAFTTSSWQANTATAFSVNQVVPGFKEGLLGMKVGGQREIVIPPKLGYGSHANGKLVATETLVFVVELKAVS